MKQVIFIIGIITGIIISKVNHNYYYILYTLLSLLFLILRYIIIIIMIPWNHC